MSIVPKPRALILYASESRKTAVQVQKALCRHQVDPVIWESVSMNGTLFNGVLNMISLYEFVVLLLDGEDFVSIRGTEQLAPRDNLILELGVILALKGEHNFFVLSPDGKSIKLPSDIEGVVLKKYQLMQNGEPLVDSICMEITDCIHGEVKKGLVMNRDTFWRAVENLENEIWVNTIFRGEIPDIIFGLNHGGSIVSGLFTYRDRRAPTVLLSGKDTEAMAQQIAGSSNLLSRRKHTGINGLIVDDTLRTGKYMTEAVNLVKEMLPEVQIKIATVLYRPDLAKYYDPVVYSKDLVTPDPNDFPFIYGRIFYER